MEREFKLTEFKTKKEVESFGRTKGIKIISIVLEANKWIIFHTCFVDKKKEK